MLTPRLLLMPALLAFLVTGKLSAAEPAWQPLFNGKDLTGWETYLGKPNAASNVPDLKRDEKGVYLEPIGKNRDPFNNFSVVSMDGRPAIHISGEGFGMMTTKENFGNYRLRLQFKWGAKKWPPREQAPRDSGLLYHVHGEPARSSGVWPACVELQIQERDCGDLYAIITRLTVPAREETTPDNKKLYHYDPAGQPTDFKQEKPIGNRCIRLEDAEKPAGEWNTIELVCFGGDSIHIVNGKVVMRLKDARQQGDGGAWVPLASGHICLQTEGAEIFYRDVELQPITAVPAEFVEK